MRKKIVAGNWKMNTRIADGKQLVEQIQAQAGKLDSHQYVIFCAPFTHLSEVVSNVTNENYFVGAQNCNNHLSGAFTGEISVGMLQGIGIKHVIIGHSERRQYFFESNELLKSKVDTLIAENMQIIFCCGEPLEIREANTQNDFVATQLSESLFHLSAEQIAQQVVIAYEPIWAIGTGKTASSEQAQEMHSFIRSLIQNQYGDEVADSFTLLYGGSCNAQNAAELFACKDVDGGLIGGASLKAETFVPIILAMP